jgi:hypothetical protein
MKEQTMMKNRKKEAIGVASIDICTNFYTQRLSLPLPQQI